MTFAIEYLDEQLSHIRAGKANPKILDCVKVMYYGAPVPLTNVATVTVPDARTIMITPWEKKIIRDIEKGILDSELGITPENNGEVIRLGIPPLTEERRRQLVKQCKQEAENAKISVRNARRDAIEALKKSIKSDGVPEDVEKDAEAEVQKIHDKFIKKRVVLSREHYCNPSAEGMARYRAAHYSLLLNKSLGKVRIVRNAPRFLGLLCTAEARERQRYRFVPQRRNAVCNGRHGLYAAAPAMQYKYRPAFAAAFVFGFKPQYLAIHLLPVSLAYSPFFSAL